MDSFKFSFTVPEEAPQFTDVNPSKEELITFLDGIVTELNDISAVKPYANIAELKTDINLIKDGESYPGLPEIKCVPIKVVFPRGSVYQLLLGDKEAIEFIKNMDGLETDEYLPGFATAVVLEVSENSFIGSFEPMSASAINILKNAAPFDVELTLYKSSGDTKKGPEAYPSIERSLDKIVDKMEGNEETYKEAVPSVERSLYKIAELYEASSEKEGDESGDKTSYDPIDFDRFSIFGDHSYQPFRNYVFDNIAGNTTNFDTLVNTVKTNPFCIQNFIGKNISLTNATYGATTWSLVCDYAYIHHSTGDAILHIAPSFVIAPSSDSRYSAYIVYGTLSVYNNDGLLARSYTGLGVYAEKKDTKELVFVSGAEIYDPANPINI